MSHLDTASLLALAPQDRPDLLAADDAGDDAAAARRHVDECRRCRTDLAGLTGFLSAWDRACAEHPLTADPARFASIQAALASTPSDLEVRRLGPERGPSNCAYCHSFVSRSDKVLCRACHAPHHLACFRAHGLCSTLSCPETRFDRPTRKPSQPRGYALRALAVAAVVLTCAGSAALLTRGVRGQVIRRAQPDIMEATAERLEARRLPSSRPPPPSPAETLEKLTLPAAKAKREKLKLAPDLDAKLAKAIGGMEVSAAVKKAVKSLKSRADMQAKGPAIGKKFFEDFHKKGIAPSHPQLKMQFYSLIMEYGFQKKVVEAAEGALTALKKEFGKKPHWASFFQMQDAKLAKLKEEVGGSDK